MNMLNYFKENGLVVYEDRQPETWQEAIELSCQRLMDKKVIDQKYVDEIIQSVNNNGPYIVIVPQVAMPHAAATSEGVYGSAISFTKFKEPIMFYDEEFNEEKPAQLFFTLAAKDSEEHLENITNLMDLLMEEEMIEKLINTHNLEDFERLL